jgi:glutaminyl-tRNA synthetase
MAVLDPVKVVITNYPADKEELAENKRMKRLIQSTFSENFISKERFLRNSTLKVFRLSIE